MTDDAHSEIRIVGLCGSVCPDSYTQRAVNITLHGAEEVGAQTRLIDLRNYELPFCDGRARDDYPPDVQRWKPGRRH